VVVELLSTQGLKAGSNVAGARAIGDPPLALASASASASLLGAACTGYTYTNIGVEAPRTASPYL
jgi:hypothetical protein